jgi:HEAT repeat protein
MKKQYVIIAVSVVVIGALLISFLAIGPAVAQTQDNIEQKVAGLIVNMPASHPAEEHWVNEQLLAIGTPAITALSGMLIDSAVGSDLKPRYAVSSLVTYAGRPGAGQQRDLVEEALLEEIRKDRPADVTAFLMEQVSRIGGDLAVPVLQNYLWEEALSDQALRSLLMLESSLAAEALREALSDVSGRQQIALIKALGETGDREAAGQIAGYANSDSWPLARISLYALAHIGEPGASDLFEQAITEQEGFRRSELKNFYLQYGRTLADNGHGRQADAIADHFSWDSRPVHLQSQALHLRTRIHGEDILDELQQIGRSASPGLARTALNLAAALEGENRTGPDESAIHQGSEGAFSGQDTPDSKRLFNGENLDGWQVIGDHPDSWGAEDGILYTDGVGSGWLATESTYDDFIFELEYRVPEGGNSGAFIRAPRQGNPAYQGLEIQILDDYADRYAELQPWQYTGSIYDVIAPSKRVTKPAGEWQKMKIRAEGPKIQVTLNGEMILNANLINHMEKADGHPGLVRRSGYIGLQNHSNRVDFRNISVRPLEPIIHEEPR